MSKENISEFMEKAAKDSALQEKLAALEQQHFEKLAALAKEAGFAIAPEDFAEGTTALSDDEMENVAGGWNPVIYGTTFYVYKCPSCGLEISAPSPFTCNCPGCGCCMCTTSKYINY